MEPDPDVRLARLLFQQQRLDVARLQALLAQAQAERSAGGAPLWRRLVTEGLLDAAEAERLGGEAGGAEPREALPVAKGSQLPGDSFGDYRLLELLGSGGMGQVYLAEHRLTRVRHALKVMRSARDAAKVERFRREGAAQARVDAHENVVRVHLAGQSSAGEPYLVTELCDGGSLLDKLGSGPLPPEEVRRLGVALARGLEHCHRNGVLHRDLKPANVLFDHRGTPKLVDFGLALVEGEESLTRTGAVVGTPVYMAPEQARGDGRRADARTDVYGLGALLYHALTGRPPFDGVGFAVLAQVVSQRPTPPRALVPAVPADLEAVVLRAMAKRPDERFPDAAGLAAALEARAAPPPRARLGRLGLAALLLGAAAGALGLAVTSLRRAAADAQAARVGAARRGAAELAAETSSALAAGRPLSADADRPAAWREARRTLLAALEGEASPALAEVERDACALEGLLALDGGRAGVAAAALQELSAGVPGDDRRVRALRGGIAALGAGDAYAATEDLTAARAAGLERPELAGWQTTARLRRIHDALGEGDARAALAPAVALARSQPCPPELAGTVTTALRNLLARLTAGTLEEVAPLRDHLRLANALRLRLDHGLSVALVDGLSARGHRLLPLVAALAPDDAEVQRRVGRHPTQLQLHEDDRRETGEEFLPAARRAVELAPDDVEAHLELFARLEEAGDAEAIGPLVEALLARPGVAGRERGRALVWRARASWRSPASAPRALEDLEAARELDPTHPLLGYHRASAHWALRETRGQRELAMREALAFVRDAEPLVPIHARAIPRATLIAWTIAYDRKEPSQAAPALEKLVASHAADPAWAGWHVRLALARAAAGDESGARASAQAAAELMPRRKALADLADDARAAAGAPPARLRAALDELAKAVGRRRPVGEVIP